MNKKILLLISAVIPIIILITALRLFALEPNGYPDATLISSDTTWTAVNSPYVLTQTVIIEPNATLTVEAGVDVQVEQHDVLIGIFVEGALIVEGTAAEPVLFTAVTQTTHSAWSGLSVQNSGTLSMSHTTLENGIHGINLSDLSAEPYRIKNSTIQHNRFGVFIQPENLHLLQMDNVTFAQNETNRVMIELYDFEETLAEDVHLITQPGLEGYEMYSEEDFPTLRVPQTISLTIEPGVSVFMPETGRILLDGYLEAIGTLSQPITFTSSSNKEPGSWYGLQIGGDMGMGHAHLKHVIIEYSTFGLTPHNRLSTVETIFDNVTVRNNTYSFETDLQSFTNLQMNDLLFENNETNYARIYVEQEEAVAKDVTFSPFTGLNRFEILFSTATFGRLFIPEDVSMTLNPGVTLGAQPVLWVEGDMQVDGTSNQPVVITDASDAGVNASGIFMTETGTLEMNYAFIEHAPNSYGVGLDGDSDAIVLIQNTVFDTPFPIIVPPNAFHRLQLENVSFEWEGQNFIYLDAYEDNMAFTRSVALTHHSGLDGYYFTPPESPQDNLHLTIPAGVQVTMAPGATLLVDEGAVAVEGELRTEGTAVSPITIKAFNDTPGGWDGIQVNGGTLHLDHAIIEQGLTNILVPETAVSSQLHIANSQIRNASQHGLSLGSGQANITCTTFSQNGADGIVVLDDANSLTVTLSQIFDNQGAGVRNLLSTAVSAIDNYWGHPSGPGGDGPGSGDEVIGNVQYEPWLNAPSCQQTYQFFFPLVTSP